MTVGLVPCGRPSWKDPYGQALVEFALILPVLVVLLLGITDLGRAIYAYNAISNAAREGGRTAIVNQNASNIRVRASSQATALGIPTAAPSSCTGGVPADPSGICVSFVMPNLTTDCSTTLTPGCVAIVTVKYTFTAITPVIGNLVGPIAMESATKQVIESVCTGAGCPIP